MAADDANIPLLVSFRRLLASRLTISWNPKTKRSVPPSPHFWIAGCTHVPMSTPFLHGLPATFQVPTKTFKGVRGQISSSIAIISECSCHFSKSAMPVSDVADCISSYSSAPSNDAILATALSVDDQPDDHDAFLSAPGAGGVSSSVQCSDAASDAYAWRYRFSPAILQIFLMLSSSCFDGDPKSHRPSAWSASLKAKTVHTACIA